MTGTDVATYTRERPGMSAFVLEDGVVYHTYSAYARGLDGLWGMYQWLDRAPKGRNETGVWWRRHDEYDNDAWLNGGDDAAVPGPDAVALPPGRGRTGETRLGRLTALVGVGYFFVWTVFGMAAFRWASRWRRSRCSSRRWRAPFRSRSVWSS
jgi:hypothetical protein